MQDRRQTILIAGLDILREEGLSGFTQPKVAAKAGLRQGNLTYYFPTRTDLLVAVARVAVDIQLAAVSRIAHSTSSVAQAAAAMAAATVQHDNSRILLALNQAADQESAVRALFNELTDGIVRELGDLLGKLMLPRGQAHTDLVHALLVGLSVISLATNRESGEARALAAIKTALTLLASAQSKPDAMAAPLPLSQATRRRRPHPVQPTNPQGDAS
jgi:AcrR family transcriptional regulator